MKTYTELKQHILSKCAKNLIPVGGEFELTSQCNLRCKMCYVRDERINFLSTEQWIEIFDNAYKNGLLYALLTGGEVFSRNDFIFLYNYLYDLGVKITIYTNGTLITGEIAQTLAKRPPEMVGITLYGSTNEVYEKVTGHNNGFTLVNQGISNLKKYKINLFVRTIAINEIMDDIDNIINYVKENNLQMLYSLYVGPSRIKYGDKSATRLEPARLVEFEQKMVDAFGRYNNREFSNSKNGFTCVALKSAYFITARGQMQPCAMLIHPSKSIINNDFLSVWNELTTRLGQFSSCKSCVTCEYNSHCIQCPAKLYLEGGFTKCSKYLREIASLRKEIKSG